MSLADRPWPAGYPAGMGGGRVDIRRVENRPYGERRLGLAISFDEGLRDAAYLSDPSLRFRQKNTSRARSPIAMAPPATSPLATALET